MHILLLILHVLGAGVLIGVVVFAFAAVVRPPLNQQALDRLGYVFAFGMWASAAQLVTGVLLITQELDELGHSPLIWTKVGLWVIEGVLAGAIIKKQAMRAGKALAQGQQLQPGSLRTTVSLQLLLILAIVILGVIVASS